MFNLIDVVPPPPVQRDVVQPIPIGAAALQMVIGHAIHAPPQVGYVPIAIPMNHTVINLVTDEEEEKLVVGQCSICLNDVLEEESCNLQCSHIFHVACINEWGRSFFTQWGAIRAVPCPQCRRPAVQIRNLAAHFLAEQQALLQRQEAQALSALQQIRTAQARVQREVMDLTGDEEGNEGNDGQEGM